MIIGKFFQDREPYPAVIDLFQRRAKGSRLKGSSVDWKKSIIQAVLRAVKIDQSRILKILQDLSALINVKNYPSIE